MLLMYCYCGQSIELLEKIRDEKYEDEIFQIVCRDKSEAIKALEDHIKSNKKLKKDGVYYIYLVNCYEYSKYGKDGHYIFSYNVGDIKVLEGKIKPEHPFPGEEDFEIIYSESLDQNWIDDYEPLPQDIIDRIMEAKEKIENEEILKIETPYDWTEKKDEIAANIMSSIDGGDFTPISIKLSDEAVKRHEEHNKKFHESGFSALVKYLSDKNKENGDGE